MNQLLAILALLLLPFFQASENGVANHATQADLAPEEYAVYAAVVSKLFACEKVTFDTQATVKLLVIKDHTTVDRLAPKALEDWEYVSRRLPSISQETANDYKERNRGSHQIKDTFNLKIEYALVRKDELEHVLKSGGWETFYEKYPDSGGYISFSRVGFNPERNQALIYFEHWCQMLCGSGIYVLLSKGEDGWKVASQYRIWIS